MTKIIICDPILDSGLALLRQAEDIELLDASALPRSALPPLLAQAELAITRSSTDVDEAFLDAAPRLRALVRAGVGVDNVNIDECSRRGVIVMNVPTANTLAAVELTMAHLLCSARSFVNAHNFLKIERKWERERWYGVELAGKCLGIIGFGNIGSRVASRAQAFGMSVLVYDPYVSAARISQAKMSRAASLDELWEHCDFISIHTPKTPETTGMIGAAELARMREGVRLINCARGGLMDEAALAQGLASGKIAWLGIDVFEKEPAANHPLLEFERVSATSHLGANTVESQEKISLQACENALNAARGIAYANALNLPVKAEDLPAFIGPYLELVSKMAFLAAGLDRAAIKAVRVLAWGGVGEYADCFLPFALVGALRGALGEAINYVNAPFLAAEKEIKSSHEARPGGDYANKITVEIITNEANISVEGTVFNENEQRIIGLNGFETDFRPKGRMIIFKNQDIPGVIAAISSILAAKGVNIADFRLGRDGTGSALAVILIDEKIDKFTLNELRSLSACLFVEYVEL